MTNAPTPSGLVTLRLTPAEVARAAAQPAAIGLQRRRRPDHSLLTSLPTPYEWDDLVLRADIAVQLRAFEAQVRLRWPVGTLAPGEKRTLQLTVRFPTSGEQFANRATARADRDLVSEAEVVTALEGAANLKAEFDRGDFVLEAGKKATYTLRVGNRGSAAMRATS